MFMITPQDSAILIAISDAGAEGGNWPAMLRALAEHLRADRAHLWLAERGWSDGGHVAGPPPEVFTGLRLGRVYTGAELSARKPANPALTEDQRAIGLRLPGAVGWLAITRTRGEFRAVESAGLAAIVPHIAQAVGVATRISELVEGVRQAEQVLRRVGVGTVRWDGRGRAVAQDAVARDLLAALPDGVSVRAEPAIQNLGPGVDLLVMPDGANGLIGYLRSCDRPLPAPALLAQGLGISVAEARLARALGQGQSLRDAAEDLALTLETARFYSKQIYAKTGLRGQPDLMRRLWTSALTLAPDSGKEKDESG